MVIAFNREKSLERLLNSLSEAFFSHSVRLVISIDKSDNSNVKTVAEKFEWNFGEKEIIEHKKNLGLRKHVLYCGELTQKFGTICVFEDDLVVSPNFLEYAEQVSSYYTDDSLIAGISLYNHSSEIETGLPFIPLKNESDVYLLQYAMSWGQVWTSSQWRNFYQWYLEHESVSFDLIEIPSHLKKWPSNSWLKYFILFCILEDKYFIYPYTSLSTNFTEIGSHASIKNTNYQVALEQSQKGRAYNLLEKDKLYRYDSFFELIKESRQDSKDIEFDLYGNKRHFTSRYVLSSQNIDFKIMRTYGLELKPHENNYFYKIEGNYFKMYDTCTPKKNELNLLEDEKFLYYFRRFTGTVLVRFLVQRIKERFRKLFSNV